MPVIEGTSRIKVAEGVYDFTVDGGAASTITLKGDNVIPPNSVITGGFIDVEVAALSATGTIAVNLEGAGDLVAAVGQASWTTGRKSIIPAGNGATSVKTTVNRSIAITIATAAYTAGKFRVVLYYK